jgi:hypothetical protein
MPSTATTTTLLLLVLFLLLNIAGVQSKKHRPRRTKSPTILPEPKEAPIIIFTDKSLIGDAKLPSTTLLADAANQPCTKAAKNVGLTCSTSFLLVEWVDHPLSQIRQRLQFQNRHVIVMKEMLEYEAGHGTVWSKPHKGGMIALYWDDLFTKPLLQTLFNAGLQITNYLLTGFQSTSEVTAHNCKDWTSISPTDNSWIADLYSVDTWLQHPYIKSPCKDPAMFMCACIPVGGMIIK